MTDNTNFTRIMDGLNEALRHAEGDDRDKGCLCGECGRRYRVDFLLDADLWEDITPDHIEMLCGACIVNRIERRGRFDVMHLMGGLTHEKARLQKEAGQ